METTWNIYWNDYGFESYLYGSKIVFENKDVTFSNELMSPGTVIKAWYSKVNFQDKKTEPTLPMVDGDNSYNLKRDIDGDNLIIRIVFFDRYENELESLIMREESFDFKCPIKTYSYQIELINGGKANFVFHKLVLKEFSNED